jgi:SAM-dependent methyltransferase
MISTLKRAKEIYQEEDALQLGKASLNKVRSEIRPYWLEANSLLRGRSPTEERYRQLSKSQLETFGYTEYNLESSKLLYDLMLKNAEHNPSNVLEIGCNAGRRLHYLHNQGIQDLNGIELNEDAPALMREAFPELADTAAIHTGSAQQILTQLPSQEFDVVYSCAVLQHIMSATEQLFDNMARVSSDLIITFENESLEPIPQDSHKDFLTNNGVQFVELRDYNEIFTCRGFEEVDSIDAWEDDSRANQIEDMVTSGFDGCYTARVFKRNEDI